MNPLFTIITINYNNINGLRKTINSVISQNYDDYEYIIIDGGSEDGSKELINSYSEKLSFWCCEKDNGIYNAMNKGVKHANGKYINFMNSGDCLYNHNTLRTISEKINDVDILLGWRETDKGNIESFNTNISALSLFEDGVFHQSAYIKRDLALKYPYNENKKIVSDWQFFFKTIVLENCSYCIIKEPLSIYDTTGISSTNTELAFIEKGELLNEMLPQKIYIDYQRFLRIDSPIISLLPQVYKYTNVHRFIYKIDYMIIKAHQFLRKTLF